MSRREPNSPTSGEQQNHERQVGRGRADNDKLKQASKHKGAP